MEFYEYPAKPWEEILKGAPSKGRHLASKLVRYESSQRLSAEEVCKKKAVAPHHGQANRCDNYVKALNHPYFLA